MYETLLSKIQEMCKRLVFYWLKWDPHHFVMPFPICGLKQMAQDQFSQMLNQIRPWSIKRKETGLWEEYIHIWYVVTVPLDVDVCLKSA